MWRRVYSLMRRDLRSQTRDYMLLLMFMAPFLLALVLRAFLPSVGAASINLVVSGDLGQDMITRLDEYASVEVVADREAVERRVGQLDDVAGIVRDGETYLIILEGNESEATAELPGLVLADIQAGGVVAIGQRELGRHESPLKPFAVSFVPLMGVMVGGLLIGFSVIEEKEDNVIAAISVSPMSRFEYVAGRSLIGVMTGLVLSIPPIYVLGAGGFDVAQVVVVTLGATLIGVILGLYIGSVATNQIEGIGVLKLAALPFTIGPLLVFLLAEKWHWTLMWIPTYWTVRGYKAIFMDGLGWSEVLRLAATGLGVSLVFLAISWSYLKRRITNTLRG